METLIGLIPAAAHEFADWLANATHASRVPESIQPELCVLGVVLPSLALLSILRDKLADDGSSWLTTILAVANVLSLIASAFLYSYAINEMLTGVAENLPWFVLLSGLASSFALAAKRGVNGKV